MDSTGTVRRGVSAVGISGRRGPPAAELLLQEPRVRDGARIRSTRARHLALQSEALLLAGRAGDARAVAQRGLEGARARGERGYEALCLLALGEAEACDDPPDVEAATTHLREALALAEPRGMRPLIAHCHLGLGKVYRRTGKQQEAQEHLTTATSMYREMDMTYWLERAQGEMRGLM